LRIFDHYHFRVNLAQAEEDNMRLFLTKAPRTKDEKPWWEKFYHELRAIQYGDKPDTHGWVTILD
ncbi:hypothetical protein CLI75_11920, partial [Porphyromonas gingivalis]